MAKVEILVPGELPQRTQSSLAELFAAHRVGDAKDLDGIGGAVLGAIRGVARGAHSALPRPVLERLPALEIIANFGVGYDGIDLAFAAERGVVVTNTPDVLTEETADTALGLLLMTVRELGAAERYLRAGRWEREGNYPLTATLRDRTVGIIGLGRIGLAIARRLEAMRVKVVYHTRRPRPEAPFPYFADLREMATAVDTLVVVVPGTRETANLVDAAILEALGPRGILINMGRGTVVDEAALIEALRKRTIHAAGLDVYPREPHVSPELIALDNVVLLPHIGSATVYTRDAMGQLVVDNLTSWFEHAKPLTPVPETPWPRKT